jgi:hypothetical protein
MFRNVNFVDVPNVGVASGLRKLKKDAHRLQSLDSDED